MHTEIEKSILFMGNILDSVSRIDGFYFSNNKSTPIG